MSDQLEFVRQKITETEEEIKRIKALPEDNPERADLLFAMLTELCLHNLFPPDPNLIEFVVTTTLERQQDEELIVMSSLSLLRKKLKITRKFGLADALRDVGELFHGLCKIGKNPEPCQ
ncbi:11191_t:CDS:2 [Paraglomus occultum]|uniref:11191_t:CDS:1 n=1 Tax=Paraglomus occultum TaxID=144539 RepID=A0A9N9FBU6_9GLOM|nr:11191_t:CDS:2 [Paraglomus occultum]